MWNAPSASTRRSSLDVQIRRPDQRANELKESRQQAARYLKRTIRAAAQSSVSTNTYHRHHASSNPSWPAYVYRVRWYISRSSVLENITFSSTLRPRQVSNTCHHIAFSMEAKAQSEMPMMPIIAAMLSRRRRYSMGRSCQEDKFMRNQSTKLSLWLTPCGFDRTNSVILANVRTPSPDWSIMQNFLPTRKIQICSA